MKKMLLSVILLLLLGEISPLSASVLDDAKKDYRSVDYLEDNVFSIRDDYVLFAGSGKIINSPMIAEVTARRKASSQIYKIKELEIDTEKFHPELKSLFRKNLFQQYQAVAKIKVSAKNMIILASYTQNNRCYFAGAYKLSDITFIPDEKLSLNKVYSTLKQANDIRNEFIFYEIIPENELPLLNDSVESNLAKRYGKNFAAMFFGKSIQIGTRKQFDETRTALEKLSEKNSLQQLLAAANKLPYDKKICSLLADKFRQLQMPRCTEIMQSRASQNDKLIFSPEIEETEKAATDEMTAQGTVKTEQQTKIESEVSPKSDRKQNKTKDDSEDGSAIDVKDATTIKIDKKTSSPANNKNNAPPEVVEKKVKPKKKTSKEDFSNITVMQLL